ncbi:VIT family-domain-containing protein [Phakopsora pachyrhizi]|uniref:VIT family-domain-containing protein n=1 Tax=Phakopsora pachyrhizi TaxID=170000 RepID=A0AAV0BGV1_PHAPC|nr:VIT family-domain-containing protein [Phakopsora pachyrhizi]
MKNISRSSANEIPEDEVNSDFQNSYDCGPVMNYKDYSLSDEKCVNGSEKASQWSNSSGELSDIPEILRPMLSKHDKGSSDEEAMYNQGFDEDERNLIDPDIVRDVIIGLSDGLTVPFGLTAGLSSLGSSRLVVLAGLAELISGAISMGIGGYLASEAERDRFLYRKKFFKVRSQEQMISKELSMEAENSASSGWLKTLLRKISRKPKVYNEIKGQASLKTEELDSLESLGITQFLLKFSEGMEDIPTIRLYISAFTIGVSYFLGGLIPMTPYFFVEKAFEALRWSILVMFLTLALFGALKAYFTGAQIGTWGYFKGSISTIIVGGGAAAASYFLVLLIDGNK